MFIDEAEIYVKGGDGGNGCVSFRREKYEAFGGPDGGEGGKGGDVILRAVHGVDTLLDFKGRHHWRAENGVPGSGSQRAGRAGEDLIVKLPPGTVVYDRDLGIVLKDLDQPGAECCIAKGGSGGRGNKSFATPTHQTPREAEPGQPGEERHLRLELKLIADVGLVGLPNAGKSTLLSRISKARPKIAAYPFTTLTPQLGIVELSGERRMVVADIPGLIEGAHEGAGLGDAFLRHIERTRAIVHVIDAAPIDGESPVAAYHTVRNEIAQFSPKLAEKPELIVANKTDLVDGASAAAELSQEIGHEVLPISAVTGNGVSRLIELMWSLVETTREPVSEQRRFDLPPPPHSRSAR